MTAADSMTGPGVPPRSGSRARQWLLELSIGVVALATGGATYLVLSGAGPLAPSERTVAILLIVNLALALALISAIVWRLYSLSRARGEGTAGAQLHVRLVVVFAAIAIVPTVAVAVFASVMLNLGVDAWFSQRVKTAIEKSSDVAQAYLAEHRQTIRSDVQSLAAEANEMVRRTSDPAEFRDFLWRAMTARKLSTAVIFDGSGQYITGASSTVIQPETPPLSAFKQASAGGVVIISDGYEDRVQALVKLDAFIDQYLLAVRYVDAEVLKNQKEAVDAAEEYAALESNRTNVQLTFAAAYSVIGLLMVLIAVSLGMNAANRIVTPISRLIGASERVSAGDLTARVETQGVDGELAALGGAFNRMTAELQSQQDELVETNRVAESRRLFTEAVLSGVSAGVLGIDPTGRIDVANPSAAAFLGCSPAELSGRSIDEVVPELAGLLAEARTNEDGWAGGQVDLIRDARTRNLSFRITSDRSGGRAGFVITFDDMTNLVAAQRSSAWGDVARRIAHEIKNPLTPIQLSAERIRRKYGREIVTDPEIFEQCTQTIIRQVGDIGRMVDEFSSFARMPQPTMRDEDIVELVRQAAFLQGVGNPSIAYRVDAPDGILTLLCDGRLVAQALTNILKNAAESVSAKFELDDSIETQAPRQAGAEITIEVRSTSDRVLVVVADNGIGLPKQDRDRLTEPYVTTRGKGTGLGLAIVKKIMEDHGGTIALNDGVGGIGAEVRLEFPIAHSPLANEDAGHEQRRQLA